MRKELLKMGENNYVFVSTHSPFLIDKENVERNVIIKKNELSFSMKINLEEHQNIIDDEVLRDAFGLDVYQDLLGPFSILVEGKNDKVILNKAFNYIERNYTIIDGRGTLIRAIASLFSNSDTPPLVVVDDDDDGKKYKKEIIKKDGYSEKNVFTISDLVGDVKENATIEDFLGKEYIISKFKERFKESFNEEVGVFDLEEDSSFMIQIREFLKSKKNQQERKGFLDGLKSKISKDFKSTPEAFDKEYPLLKKLAEAIKSKLDKPIEKQNT